MIVKAMIPIRDQNPTYRIPYVTYTLIAINVIVFVFVQTPIMSGLANGNEGPWLRFADQWTIIPAQLVDSPMSEFFTVFSAMFLHGSFLHLGSNMLYLWIFGDNIEDKMGHFRYLLFYLACGIVATLAQVMFDPNSTIPNVGASGAIAGVLGGYFLLFPMINVVTMVPILFFRMIQLPALVVLGLWFAMQLFSGWSQIAGSSGGGGGVAFWAHIGGFVAGVLLIRIMGNTPELNRAQVEYFDREEERWKSKG